VGTHQAERLVQPAFGIAKSRRICQTVGSEKPLSFLFIGQVNEGEENAAGFDGRSQLSQLGDRLATKRSTKVTEKYEEYS